VRTTIEAMAAVFGGTQSLHTNSFDEALALPSDEAARIARNTQLILQHESGLCDVIDPWAGSYMMENLTHQLAAQARTLMQKIADQGGVVASLSSGWIARSIDAAASGTQARIDSCDHVIVGENRFAAPSSQRQPVTRQIDGATIRASQTACLERIRATRNADAVRSALVALTRCAVGGEGNLLSLTINAVRYRATIGECTAALEQVWPRFRAKQEYPHDVYGKARANDGDWQSLRREAQQCASLLGHMPRILIAKLGQDGHDRGAKAVSAALTDAGFEVILGPLFQSPEELARRALTDNVDIVGISSLAGGHMRLMQSLIRHLGVTAGRRIPVFLGGVVPANDHALLREYGIAGIFGPGARMDEIIVALLRAIGVGTPIVQ
jgi:methylmalonyl-CoA mutase